MAVIGFFENHSQKPWQRPFFGNKIHSYLWVNDRGEKAMQQKVWLPAVLLSVGAMSSGYVCADVNLPSVKVTAAAESAPVLDTTGNASAGVLGDRSLMQTPFSVTVIDQSLMQKQQAAYLGDFLKNDPSAVISNVPVGFLTLRGFSLGTDGALYDGLPGQIGLTDGRGQIEGIDRVEVLKGASAFLNGVGTASSLGGTLNYLPKRPLDQSVQTLKLGYTSDTLWGVHADLGDRLGSEGQFGYRVNLAYKDGEQALEGYDWTHEVATFAFDWRANDDLTFALHHDVANNDLPRLQPFFILGPAVTRVPDAPAADRNIAQTWDDFETENKTTYARADWQFASDWALTAQLLHSSANRPPVKNARFGSIDNDAGDVTLFGDQSVYREQADSARLSVNGAVLTGHVRHELTLSASAYEGETSGSTSNDALGFFTTNLYNPVYSLEPAAIALTTGRSATLDTQSVAISDVLHFNPQWSTLLGLRRADLTTNRYDITSGINSGSDELTETTPTAALMYRPTAQVLTYFSVAEGVEPGGTAPAGTGNQDQRLPALITEQMELGVKWQLPHVALTAAVFDMQRPLEYVNTAGFYVQEGEQRHQGVEVMLSGKVMPDLALIAGTMLLDTEVENGDAATDGNRAIGTSTFTASVWADYHLPNTQGVFVNAGVFYSGPQYLDVANTLEVDGYTRVDVGARYESSIHDQAVDYLLSVENLANDDYWTGAQSSLLVLGDPRTVKASMIIDF